MAEQENVCVRTEETGHTAAAEKIVRPTVLGKFKDVDALVKAYGALEAEFTRRSQRIKELEAETERLKNNSKAGNGVEKLRRSAEARRARGREFDQFVAGLEERGDTSEKGEKEVLLTPESPFEAEASGNGEGLPVAAEEIRETASDFVNEEVCVGTETENARGCEAEPFVAENQKTEIAATSISSDPETLYREASKNEEVRRKIVGDYLKSLHGAGAPILRGGARTLATPPKKAKSIAEAGDMALRLLKKTQA